MAETAARFHSLPPATRDKFQRLSGVDTARYHRECAREDALPPRPPEQFYREESPELREHTPAQLMEKFDALPLAQRNRFIRVSDLDRRRHTREQTEIQEANAVHPHGLMAYTVDGDTLFIDELYVDKLHRAKRGIARTMILRVVNAYNVTHVHLLVRKNAKLQAPARNFYRKLGFEPMPAHLKGREIMGRTIRPKSQQLYMHALTTTACVLALPPLPWPAMLDAPYSCL